MSAWQELFSELRRVYGNVSELFGDAERLLDGIGYESAHGKGNRIGIERSGHIEAPDWWAPHWIARFYWHHDKELREAPLLYIGCILSDGGAMDYKLPGRGEPVVTAGIIHAKQGVDSNNLVRRDWMAKYWLWEKSVEWPQAEPVWYVLTSERLAGMGVEKIETFAVPLIGIQKRADVQMQLIDRLINRAGLQGLRRELVEEDADPAG